MAAFNSPCGIATDSHGNIYVADGSNNVVREIAAVPTVTAITPNSGPNAGGTKVTITGANLTGASRVMFGTNQATSFKVKSGTITAVSPSGSTGTVAVTVTTPAGTSASVAADDFTYTG